jgi:hypothetical protein
MNDADVVIGEVQGYRAFEIRGQGLWSIGYKPYQWLPGVNQAHCDLVTAAPSKQRVWINDPTTQSGLVEKEEMMVAHGRIPSPMCTCGFWLYKSEAKCRQKFPQLSQAIGRSSTGSFGDFGTEADDWVMGNVVAWGRAIEGSDGYRAEFARIVAIVTDSPSRLARVLELYGVDAVPPRSKAQEGLSTAWITQVSPGEPFEVKLNHPDPGNSEDEIGTFVVDRGVTVPSVGSRVTVRFEWRGAMRWISAFTVHPDEEEM